jgi:outer membrane lipopolysaccharide assembly protein LptE/RlpB
MPSLRRRRLSTYPATAAFLLLLSGCGYHTVQGAAHLSPSVHLVDVPIFSNHTQTYRLEMTMTEAVVKELQSRTAYRVETRDDASDADAVIHGEITSFQAYPLTYDSTTNQSSSYQVNVGARVRVTDRNKRVLYENNNYVFREQYQTTQDLLSFIQEDPAALSRLSRDFARNLVADILESF